MFEEKMVKYNHPGDPNVWFLDFAKGLLPKWAVNVQPYEEDSEQ